MLAENDKNPAQKTFSLILPPPLMCSTPRMIKAFRRVALAVWKLGEIQTHTNEESTCRELLVKIMEPKVSQSKLNASLFGLQIENQNTDVRMHNNRKSDEDQMVQNFQSVSQLSGLKFASEPNFNLVPKIYATGPKTADSHKSMNAREPDPHCSIQEHCTVTHLSTNLSSVQRKYVGLWRPNKRCYRG